MSARPSRAAALAGLVVLLAIVFALSLAVGAVNLPLSRVLDVLAGSGLPEDRTIILDLRLPRALLAVVAGGALALSGAIFQALLRNPLAEPYVLGVSGGAATGAVATIVLGLGTRAAFTPIGALAGALLTVAIVLRIAYRVGRTLDSRILLLAGVIVGAFFNAIILLLLTLADVESFRDAIFWMMGNLQGADWRSIMLLMAYVIPAAIALFALARPLNLLAAGEDTAMYLGVRVTRVKLIAYIVASILVAATVAICGTIGFIGLVVPHGIRMLWGGDHRFLLPASFVVGGAFLLLADTGARIVAAPTELPIGVITALIGVPMFVLLLRRTNT